MSAKASLPLAAVCVWAVVIGWARCQDGGSCLKGGQHKPTPGPEPHLQECQLYSDNACCSALSPVSLDDIYWDQCGSLSPRCEGFLKRLACFYRCSPDAARWPHPSRPTAIQAVPLCLGFCQQWFDACKDDLTCARNWMRDTPANNCTGNCVTFQQMYGGGRELCQSLWGDSFLAVSEEEGSCACLTLNASDREAMEALQSQEGSPEELDTTKSGLPIRPAPCGQPRSATAPPLSGRRQRKRSVFIEDVEGSGSGF